MGLFIAMRSFEFQSKIEKRINSFGSSENDYAEKEQKSAPVFKEKKGIFKSKLRDYFSKTVSSQKEEQLQRKLLQAGNPLNMTVTDFYIINNILRVSIPLLFGAYAKLLGLSIFGVFLSVFIGFLLSFKALELYINSKIKNRYKKALRELPDFLDLLTISVEAGLGFDIALNKIISKRSGVLSSEFFVCLEEIRLGKTRKEALLGVKERLAFDEMKSFINGIIQAEKLGVGIVQTLRAKSEDERDKRKQRAEEEAMKTSIKILFPLIFFIFPSIFIIVFGPVTTQLLSAFSKVK
jgi:tight adherence protein C